MTSAKSTLIRGVRRITQGDATRNLKFDPSILFLLFKLYSFLILQDNALVNLMYRYNYNLYRNATRNMK